MPDCPTSSTVFPSLWTPDSTSLTQRSSADGCSRSQDAARGGVTGQTAAGALQKSRRGRRLPGRRMMSNASYRKRTVRLFRCHEQYRFGKVFQWNTYYDCTISVVWFTLGDTRGCRGHQGIFLSVTENFVYCPDVISGKCDFRAFRANFIIISDSE